MDSIPVRDLEVFSSDKKRSLCQREHFFYIYFQAEDIYTKVRYSRRTQTPVDEQFSEIRNKAWNAFSLQWVENKAAPLACSEQLWVK